MNTKWYYYSLGLLLLSHTSILQAENMATRCDANQGLYLLNQNNPPLPQIKALLDACDKTAPNDVQVLLLHGLLARKEGMKDNQYSTAINWLEQARSKAPEADLIPSLELGVTYEWANQAEHAQAIYQQILKKHPQSRPAQLGLARTETSLNHLEKALSIYKTLLSLNPHDTEALNGIGRVMMAYKIYDQAANYFNQVLSLQPDNADAQIGMNQVHVLNHQMAQSDSLITPVFACDPNQGLHLINQPAPPFLLVEQILRHCEREHNQSAQVLMLHGLMERAQKKYPQAIDWLKKAKAAAAPDNPSPALELAITYEWAHLYSDAQLIYDEFLATKPEFRPALLGTARLALWQKRYVKAHTIYSSLLKKNPQDIDALNGLGRVSMATRDDAAAQNYFKLVLNIQPQNLDAKTGLAQLAAINTSKSKQAPSATKPVQSTSCNVADGLLLVNATHPNLNEVHRILNHCDKIEPRSPQVYLLHGLLARVQKNYTQAIKWLLAAQKSAPEYDPVPTQELALTYEWALQFKKAKVEYAVLLAKNPKSRPALLGLARVETAEYHIRQANLIYTQLLTTNPQDIDALNGMGRLQLTDKKFKQARSYFNQALQLKPQNTDSLIGLEQLNNSTRYMASFNQGQYRVLDKQANSSVLYGYADINATDRIIGIATHNSQQLDLDITIEPTLLPNNSLYLAYQRQIPQKYGWGVNYDFRQHDGLPIESRAGATGNIYIFTPLQWFGGFWTGFPSPWNNQLYFSGLTYYTKLPFNISVTGYWGKEQIGGQNTTYAIDLSKEFANAAFYNVGTSYNTTQKFWGYHGRIIWPTFKNQALEGSVEHYNFNRITIFAVGWRLYWA